MTLWNTIKQITAPYVLDGEYSIALDTMQGNWASSRGKVEVLWFFSSCGAILGYIPELQWGWPFTSRVCSVTSGLLSSYMGHHRNLLEACQGNKVTSRGEARDRESLSSCHSDTGIPINFLEESGIATF